MQTDKPFIPRVKVTATEMLEGGEAGYSKTITVYETTPEKMIEAFKEFVESNSKKSKRQSSASAA